MRVGCLLGIFLVISSCLSSAVAGSTGPDDRQITDPKSVTSVPNPSARPAPIDDLFYTRSVFGAAWSPDGEQIAFTADISGRFNLWKVRAAGGWPIQLAQSDDRQYNATWSPDGKWIVYQQDKAGDELYDLYAIPSDGGQPLNLTNTPDVREESPLWSPNGQTLALTYKPKDGSVYDVALLDWATRKVHKLTNEKTDGYRWGVVAWSKDGKTVFANRVNPAFTDADIYGLNVATGETENLTTHNGTASHFGSSLSPDGSAILLTSNAKAGYMNVALLNLATKKLSWVTDAKWEASAGTFSPDGKSFTYTVNEDGLTDAYLADRSTYKAAKLDLPPGLNVYSGTPTEFAPRGDRLIVSHEASNQPGDLWIYNLTSRHADQLTFSTIASLQATALPPAQIVHYKSFDGKIISALLWIPFNLKRDGTNPALVMPHGGPTGQTINDWIPDRQALASRGYICIAPNPRGSTGFGLDFQKANYQDLGGGDLKDELGAVEFLKASGYVDPNRIGITGGSYGGYMTLMALGKTPAVWAAGVERYGIIDWSSMLKSSDPALNEYLKSLLGDPEQNHKFYVEDSPITFIRDVKAPLLVLQGDNDPRVPKEEAQQIVDILKKQGRVVEVQYYANEGHGFVKRENQIDAIRRTVDWFEQYLKGNLSATSNQKH